MLLFQTFSWDHISWLFLLLLYGWCSGFRIQSSSISANIYQSSFLGLSRSYAQRADPDLLNRGCWAASEVGVFPPLSLQPYACFHILAGVVCMCVSLCVCVCVCVCISVIGSSSLLQGSSLSEIIRSASSMTLWILPCPAIGWEPLIIAMVINLSPRNQPETIQLILCRPLGNAETLGENCIFVWKESLWTTSARFNWTVSLILTERGQRSCRNSHRSDLTDGLVTLCSIVLFLPFEIFSRKGVNRRVLGQKR